MGKMKEHAVELLEMLETQSPASIYRHGAMSADALAYACEGEALAETRLERKAYLFSEARRHRDRAANYRNTAEMLS